WRRRSLIARGVSTPSFRQLWLPNRTSRRRRLTPKTRAGPPRRAYSFRMPPRRHRMRRQARRESSRAWIASGAAVTINTYARRYGVDRYTAHEDLTAIGFPLPDSAQQWAHRPASAAQTA